MAYLGVSNILSTTIVVVPPKWPKHKKMYRIDGFTATGRYLCRLPVDFYLHQISKRREPLTSGDTRTLINFCSQWGAMEHPLRYSRYLHCLDPFLDLDSAKHQTEALMAIAETDRMRKSLNDDSIISMSECIAAIRDLADAIDWLNRHILGTIDPLVNEKGEPSRIAVSAHIVNAGAIAQGVLAGPGMAVIGKHQCNLTNAICNQIIEVFSEDSDWHKCKWCGYPYKHYRRGPDDYGADRRKCTSQYCSKACSDAASKSAKSKPRNTH